MLTHLADESARFSADQFHTVGISFVRHEATTRGEAIGQLDKVKLLTAIDDQILGEFAEVRRQQRSPVQKVRWKNMQRSSLR